MILALKFYTYLFVGYAVNLDLSTTAFGFAILVVEMCVIKVIPCQHYIILTIRRYH